MNKAKAAKLRKAGFRVTDTKEFLELNDAESALVELKIALTGYLKEVRIAKKVSQSQLAKMLGSSQSRVAKMEAANSNVSFDLIFRALLTLGENPKKLGKAIAEAA